jgi:hypothetical protein
MAYKELLVALSAIIAISPASATQPLPSREGGAPPAPPYARYCLRVDPATGSRMETIRCETREGWADLDVDVDKEWAEWGVRIVTSRPLST